MLEEALCVVPLGSVEESEVLLKMVSKEVDKMARVEEAVILAATLLTVLRIVKRGEKLRPSLASAAMAMP
jgi:hypothetical protein